MIRYIVKRSGDKVSFDARKIKSAIFKANTRIAAERMSDADLNELTEEVLTALEKLPGTPTAQEIQNVVEEKLLAADYAKTANAYINYRTEHEHLREMDDELVKIFENLTFRPSEEDDLKRENANINADTAMGTMLKYGSESAKAFYDKYVIPPEIAKAHASGDIHIHDKDFYALTETCCQIDLLKLFQDGFSTGHGYLREPNDIRSYAALACIAIQANQNEMHGGQSVPNFDYAMAEGVKKTYRKQYFRALAQYIEVRFDMSASDAAALTAAIKEALGTDVTMHTAEAYAEKLRAFLPRHQAENGFQIITGDAARAAAEYAAKTAYKETDAATYQAMEALVHNLNTMNSRAGAQVPFSSLNYGTDTSPEGRMAVHNLLRATEAGLGDGETPIFPVQIFKVKEGVNYNEGDPNYDLFRHALRCSAKRLFPNFSFQDAPFNLQYYKEGHPETEIAYMGCRTRVMGNHFDPSRETTCGRGNLSFTSINLPRLGIEAKGDIDKFFASLDERMDLVVDQLMHRYKIQAQKKVRNYPFLMGQGIWLDSEKLNIDDEVGEVLKHGSLTIGFIGLAETLKALIGVHHGESEEARQLGLKIVSHMRERMDQETQKTGFNYTLIATPAEGLSGRFVRMDKEKYGIIEGVTDREYYTNSFHVPVYYPISAFEKIRIEAPYHNLTNGGHISYIELDGDPSNNLEAFEQIIRCMKESGIGYGSVNHPVDRDPVCGYSGIIEDVCPKCGRTEADGKPGFERIRRITGYLVGTVDRFNNAKRAEERDRVKHGLN